MSAAAYFGSEHRWPGIISAINFLLVSAKLKDISEKGRVFRSVPDLVREIMELDMLIKQCWLDIRRRAQPPVTAGMVRWGTVLGAAEYLDKKGPLLLHTLSLNGTDTAWRKATPAPCCRNWQIASLLPMAASSLSPIVRVHRETSERDELAALSTS